MPRSKPFHSPCHAFFRVVVTAMITSVCCQPSLFAQDEPAPAVLAPVLPPQGIVIQAAPLGDGPLTLDGANVVYSTFEFGGAGFGPDPAQMVINNRQVQQELELVDSQLESLRKIQQQMQQKQKEQSAKHFARMRSGKIDRLDIANLQERQQAMKDEYMKKVEEVLLPHQVKRLKQVALHTQMQRRGAANALNSKAVAEELGISDEQQQKLREKSAELNAKLQKQIAELKTAARKELLNELTPAQQKKLKELLGDDYKPQRPQSAFRTFSSPALQGLPEPIEGEVRRAIEGVRRVAKPEKQP